MRLRQTTLLAILATAYFFILRTVGTVFPDLFHHHKIIQTGSVLSLLFCLALLSFFVAFKKNYLTDNQKTLKTSTNGVIFGYIAMSCVYAVEFLNIFQINFLSDLLNSRLIETAVPVVPWMASVFVFVFFLTFHQERKKDKQNKLRYPILFAILGGAISLLLRTILLWRYISVRAGKWDLDLFGIPLVVGFILVSASFLFVEYFFLSFFFKKDIIPHSPN